ncbi:carbohydrate kinase [Flavobacteriaceae bacterium Ap0902]|nr:carbohydrate kinase [Flavobacteriaceae bacterium Ap0902]
MKSVVCFGEILWDDFPTGKVVGGAPLNVALRLSQLGVDASIISRRGRDDNGKEISEFIKERGLDTSQIQIDEKYPTGLVKVMLNEKGSASYDIVYPSAWDKIQINPTALKKVQSADAFVFGSLACRDMSSRDSLYKLIDQAKYKVFDVNLRPPYYDIDIIADLMNKSDFIKLNDDELYEVAEKLGSPYKSLEKNLKYIADKTNSTEVCVTKGRHGAVYLKDDQFHYHSGFKVRVVDTVGSGDSFLASLLYKILNKVNPEKALEFACAMGALVASQNGATTPIPIATVEEFINPLGSSQE